MKQDPSAPSGNSYKIRSTLASPYSPSLLPSLPPSLTSSYYLISTYFTPDSLLFNLFLFLFFLFIYLFIYFYFYFSIYISTSTSTSSSIHPATPPFFFHMVIRNLTSFYSSFPPSFSSSLLPSTSFMLASSSSFPPPHSFY